jgi:hypothetical protein
MAAQLKDGGRYPAVQKLKKDEFVRFVEACQESPKPSERLKMLAMKTRRISGCRSI